MKFHRLAVELGRKTRQKEFARALSVTPRTIRNWNQKIREGRNPKLGRPAHDERAHRAAFWAVGREFQKQGRPGSLAIDHALPEVPTRLVQHYTRVFKACARKHKQRRILRKRERVEVLAKNALWVQDSAQIGRHPDGSRIESQVVKDRGPLVTVGIATSGPTQGTDVIDLLERLKQTRGLPLVLGTDNGAPYVCEATEDYLKREKVIHLRSLPRTPQHNGSAEVGIGEIKRGSGLSSATIIELPEAHDRAVCAAFTLNKNRLRMSKGFKTGAELDETMDVGYHRVERDWFYEECSQRIEQAQHGTQGARERRMAEREAILSTMERCRLVRRHRGGSQAPTKAEIFS